MGLPTIERIIYRMYKQEDVSFIATTLQCMTIHSTDYISTAGVMFNKKIKQFELLINEKWFDSLPSDENRIAVMKHELDHIFFKHVFIPQEIVLSKNKTKINISMDLVINQLIKNLPKDCFTIEKIKDKNKKQFPPNLTFEGYYDLLDDATMEIPNCSGNPGDHNSFSGKGKSDKKSEEKSEGGEGSSEKTEEQKAQDAKDRQQHTGHNCDGTCKGHDGNKKGKTPSTREVDVKDYYEEHPFDEHQWSEAEQQEAMEASRDLIKRSMQKASFTGTKVPGYAQDCLDQITADLKKINYKELLLKALRQSLPSKDIRKTWKRPSRRLGDIAKGNMSGLMPKMEFLIDTSGSISIVEANECLQCTNNFMTVGVSKATLWLWHTTMYYSEKIKKNFEIGKDKFQSGGTDLQPVINHLAKVKPDLAVIYTDGYYGNTEIPKGFTVPIVFIITKQGDKKHPLYKYGTTVQQM